MLLKTFTCGLRHDTIAGWLLAAGARRGRRGYCRPVTSLAWHGSGLVVQHVASVHGFDIAVATDAADVLVHALERQSGAAVVKKGRLPLVAVVTAFAFWGRRGSGELAGVDIPVAALAGIRRRSEINVQKVGFEIWRLVAIRTGDPAVRADQDEFCGRVVEARQLLPRRLRVASFTASWPTRAGLPHAFRELAPMRVAVASGAGAVLRTGNVPPFRSCLLRLVYDNRRKRPPGDCRRA